MKSVPGTKRQERVRTSLLQGDAILVSRACGWRCQIVSQQMTFQTCLLIRLLVSLRYVEFFARLQFSGRLVLFSSPMPSWYFHDTKTKLTISYYYCLWFMIFFLLIWVQFLCNFEAFEKTRELAYQHIELWQQRAWEDRITKRPKAGWTNDTKVTATSVITIVVLSFRIRIACFKKQNLTFSE